MTSFITDGYEMIMNNDNKFVDDSSIDDLEVVFAAARLHGHGFSKSLFYGQGDSAFDTDLSNSGQPFNMCIGCGQNDTVIACDGMFVCMDCGHFNQHVIDASAEWRSYAHDDSASRRSDLTRCGAPINELMPNTCMTTAIGYVAHEQRDMRLVRRYSSWNTLTYRDRSLFAVFDTIMSKTQDAGISKNIVEEAKVLYKRISDTRISRGDLRKGLIATSVYMACKAGGAPRSIREIATMFDIKPTVVTRACRCFQNTLQINSGTTNAQDLVTRFCSKIGISNNIRISIVSDLVQRVELESNALTGSTPQSIVASCILVANKQHDWNLSKQDVCDACNISLITATKCFRKLQAYILQQETTDLLSLKDLKLEYNQDVNR